jgi:hypothetical protein
MKKGYLFLLMVLFLGLVACGKNTAVVATSDLLTGNNGKVVLINTDDLTQVPVTVDGVNGLSQQVIVSPDGATAYVCNALGDNRICIVNLLNQSSAYLDLDNAVWDMALTADGAKLVVGKQSTIDVIEIYDTVTLDLLQSFAIAPNVLDYFQGRKLVLDPEREVIYLIATNWLLQSQVRAYTFDGTMLGDGYAIDSDLPVVDDYDIAIAPAGDLLLAVSSKIYPYTVSDAGLTALDPIDAKVSGNKGTLFGKTKILFTKNTNMVYVNSAGLWVPPFNLGGSAYCLDKEKILANDPNPFVFSQVDFFQDAFIKWIVGLLSKDIADIIDQVSLYGIADSTVEGDTCYMVIASVGSWALDLAGEANGKCILSIFYTLPVINLNVWVGGKIFDTYPSAIGINRANDTLVLSYFWKNQVGVFKKDPILGWLLTEETKIDLGNYPKALSMSTQKTSPF